MVREARQAGGLDRGVDREVSRVAIDERFPCPARTEIKGQRDERRAGDIIIDGRGGIVDQTAAGDRQGVVRRGGGAQVDGRTKGVDRGRTGEERRRRLHVDDVAGDDSTGGDGSAGGDDLVVGDLAGVRGGGDERLITRSGAGRTVSDEAGRRRVDDPRRGHAGPGHPGAVGGRAAEGRGRAGARNLVDEQADETGALLSRGRGEVGDAEDAGGRRVGDAGFDHEHAAIARCGERITVDRLGDDGRRAGVIGSAEPDLAGPGERDGADGLGTRHGAGVTIIEGTAAEVETTTSRGRIRPAALAAGDDGSTGIVEDVDIGARTQREADRVLAGRGVDQGSREMIDLEIAVKLDRSRTAGERAIRRAEGRRAGGRSADLKVDRAALADPDATGEVVGITEDDALDGVLDGADDRNAGTDLDRSADTREVVELVVGAKEDKTFTAVKITAAGKTIGARSDAITQARREGTEETDFRVKTAGQDGATIADRGHVQRAGVERTDDRQDRAVSVGEGGRIKRRGRVEVIVVDADDAVGIETAEDPEGCATDGAGRPVVAGDTQRGSRVDLDHAAAKGCSRGGGDLEITALDLGAAGVVAVVARDREALVIIGPQLVQDTGTGDLAGDLVRAVEVATGTDDGAITSGDRGRTGELGVVVRRTEGRQLPLIQGEVAELEEIADRRLAAGQGAAAETVHVHRGETIDHQVGAERRLVADDDGGIDASSADAEVEGASPLEDDGADGARGVIGRHETAETEDVLDEERALVDDRAAGVAVVARIREGRQITAEREDARAALHEGDRTGRAIGDLAGEERTEGHRAGGRRHIGVITVSADGDLRRAVDRLDGRTCGDILTEHRHTHRQTDGGGQFGDGMIILAGLTRGLEIGGGRTVIQRGADLGAGRKVDDQGRRGGRGISHQAARDDAGNSVGITERVERDAASGEVERTLIVQDEVRLQSIEVGGPCEGERAFLDRDLVRDAGQTGKDEVTGAELDEAGGRKVAAERGGAAWVDVDQTLTREGGTTGGGGRIEDDVGRKRAGRVDDQAALVGGGRAADRRDLERAAGDIGSGTQGVDRLDARGGGEAGDGTRDIDDRGRAQGGGKGAAGVGGVSREGLDARGRGIEGAEAADAADLGQDAGGQDAVHVRGGDGDGVDIARRDQVDRAGGGGRTRERTIRGTRLDDERARALADDIEDREVAVGRGGTVETGMATATIVQDASRTERNRLIGRGSRLQVGAAVEIEIGRTGIGERLIVRDLEGAVGDLQDQLGIGAGADDRTRTGLDEGGKGGRSVVGNRSHRRDGQGLAGEDVDRE